MDLFPSQQIYQRFYIHRLTKNDILDELIEIASNTKSFTIDTQHRRTQVTESTCRSVPALIQIQFHCIDRPTIILLVEVTFLKSKFSIRLHDAKKERKFKELFKQILSSEKHIYAWGNPKIKLIPFLVYQLFTLQDLDQPFLHNIQNYFLKWYETTYAHSKFVTDTPSLGTAMLLVFNEPLDTEMEYALWDIGIDLKLQTYDGYKSLSTCAHVPQHIEDGCDYRHEMTGYAVNNCMAISKLMLLILQQWPPSMHQHEPGSNLIYLDGRDVQETYV